MSRYAAGKKAFGFCDRTGFRYPLEDLVPQYENGTPTGLLVGRDVVDIDHEQLQIGRVRSNDPQTLIDPRPDTAQDTSRRLFSFDPVGANMTEMVGHVGRVTVSTS
jgi:hypothetical protein